MRSDRSPRANSSAAPHGSDSQRTLELQVASSTDVAPATRADDADGGERVWVSDDARRRDRARVDYAEMMARYLGPVIMTAMADDDVTEMYVKPQDGACGSTRIAAAEWTRRTSFPPHGSRCFSMPSRARKGPRSVRTTHNCRRNSPRSAFAAHGCKASSRQLRQASRSRFASAQPASTRSTSTCEVERCVQRGATRCARQWRAGGRSSCAARPAPASPRSPTRYSFGPARLTRSWPPSHTSASVLLTHTTREF